MTTGFSASWVPLVIAVGGAVAAHAAGPGPAAPASRGLLHVRRAEIVDGKGRPVVLHAVAFGNAVWGNVRIPRQHHDEFDYARLKAMGMNAVRFYMNYRTFESDDAPGQYLADGWQWLDDNIAWAKKHGIYLVLNMHCLLYTSPSPRD